MNPLPLIPTPAAQRWRDLRLRSLPLIVVVLVLVLTCVLWTQRAGVPLLVGEAETLRADVTAITDGVVTEVHVRRFQVVAAGDPIALVSRVDPETLRAQLAAIQADLQLTGARMALDAERNVQNHEQLRLDLMAHRIDLATARVNLQQAESELQRVTRLYQDRIVAPGISPDGGAGYELALRDRDALLIEVNEKASLIDDLERTLRRLRDTFPLPEPGTLNDPVNAAITAQENQLQQLGNPVTLRAPMAGMVTAVMRVPGESLIAGTAIATVSAMQSEHIVGYVRQPLSLEPEIGMLVHVRTRGVATRTATERILQVGADMRLVTAPLRIRGFDPALERGLPILIRMPESLKPHVRPGELVDLRILLE